MILYGTVLTTVFSLKCIVLHLSVTYNNQVWLCAYEVTNLLQGLVVAVELGVGLLEERGPEL